MNLLLTGWDFVEREKPNFDLVALCPPMIYGPLRNTISSTSQLSQSNRGIYDKFFKSSATSPLPPNGLYLYVDVRDIATAHVLAATVPAAGGRRFLVTPGTITSQQIADILHESWKLEEQLQSRTPIGTPGANGLPEHAYGADTTVTKEVLGLEHYIGAQHTFEDLGEQFLALEKKMNAEEWK